MTRQTAPADRLVTLPGGHPERTLGYEAIRWATMYLHHPDGERAGQRWAFTQSQAQFIIWWYAIDPETGRWVYSHAVRRLAKGAGKALWPPCWRWSSSARRYGWPVSMTALLVAA